MVPFRNRKVISEAALLILSLLRCLIRAGYVCAGLGRKSCQEGG